MSSLRAPFLILISTILCALPGLAAAESSGWMYVPEANRLSKKMEKNGMRPSRIRCRVRHSTFQVRLDWVRSNERPPMFLWVVGYAKQVASDREYARKIDAPLINSQPLPAAGNGASCAAWARK
jgi:hypothetical protein